MEFKDIELVVFDLAGTTVSETFGVHQIMIEAFASRGFQITEEQASLSIAVPKPVGILRILKSLGIEEGVEELQGAIYRSFQVLMVDFYRNTESLEETLGTSKLFAYLQSKGIKVGTDTGFDRLITDVILDRMGWGRNGLLDASVCSDEVKNGRPAPDMILRLMEMTGVKDVNKVIKIGDTPTDVRQGKDAGCQQVIAKYSGAFSKDDLQAEQPDLIVDSLEELI